ncbi:MAG: potassium channel family protein [Patescibacteria group bacterium]
MATPIIKPKPKTTKQESLLSILSDREFIALALIVLIILLGGAVFYHAVEGWRLLDGFYFSVITLTTVGYGDFSPATDLGKIFTMIFIFIGVGIILALINIVARHAKQHNPLHDIIDDTFGDSPRPVSSHRNT